MLINRHTGAPVGPGYLAADVVPDRRVNSHRRIPKRIANLVYAAPLDRAHYQWSVLRSGTWSGADLRGTAARYAGRYEASRCALVERINAALRSEGWFATCACLLTEGSGVPPRWRRSLILTSPSGAHYLWEAGRHVPTSSAP